MNSVWADVNRLMMMRHFAQFTAFDIRDGITPAHGFLQIMLTESQDPEEARILNILFGRMQEVESILQEWIAAETDAKKLGAKAMAVMKEQGAKTVKQIILMNQTLSGLHQEILRWQEEGRFDGTPERMAAMLQGLWQAEKLCRELSELAR